MAEAVSSWLQDQERGRRLVVFDNVTDPDAVRRFLPRSGSTRVIITTNRREVAELDGFSVVQVGMFTPEQGQRFLHEATGLPASDDAAAIGAQLGWLPLGLAQAAAYIVGNRLSYRQYLRALEKQSLDETLRRRAGTDHPGVLKATALSMAGLDRDDPTGRGADAGGVA